MTCGDSEQPPQSVGCQRRALGAQPNRYNSNQRRPSAGRPSSTACQVPSTSRSSAAASSRDVHSRQLRALGGASWLPATPAAIGPGRRLLPAVRRHGRLRRLPVGHCRPGRGGGRRGRAAGLPSRPDAPRAGGGQARAGGEAGVPDAGRLRDGAWRRATGPDASCWWARTITTSRSRSRSAPLVAEGTHWRDGLRALHDHRAPAQDAPTTGATTRRWPAATRSSRRAFTGCTWRAASARRSSRAPMASARRSSRAGPGPAREEHDGGVPLRQRRCWHPLLLARDSVAAEGPAPLEALRPRGHHHLRVQRRVRAGPRPARPAAAVSRVSATSAATRRCIATS